MTAAVLRGTPSLSVPPSQNTAPVLEFNCLYTHDLRRKQKRWQDGFLRYHTFNKRVMVYDVPRNFLGDLHWAQAGELQEGDEITLEKSGILVQVSEQVGRTETDLSGLLHRKDRSSPARNSSSPRPAPLQTRVPAAQSPAMVSQMKHKSLNTLLGSKRGPIGKAAFPPKSPFEVRSRNQENEDWELGRSSKRQRTENWNVVRTTKASKPTAAGSVSASRPKPAKVAANSLMKPASTSQRRLDVTEVIDILSDTEETPTGNKHGRAIDKEMSISLPSIAQEHSAAINRAVPQHVPQARQEGSVRREPDMTPDASLAESPSVRHIQRKQALADIRPKVLKSANTVQNAEVQTGCAERPKDFSRSDTTELPSREGMEVIDSSFSTESTSQKQGKTLKLVGSAPRKMLVFQNRAPKAAISTSTSNMGPNQQSAASSSEFTSIHRQRLQERLSRVSMRQMANATTPAEQHESPAVVRTTLDKAANDPPLPGRSKTSSTSADNERVNGSSVAVSREGRTGRPGQMFLRPSKQAVGPSAMTKEMPPPAQPLQNRGDKARVISVLNARSVGNSTTLQAQPCKAAAARQPTATKDLAVDKSAEAEDRKEEVDLGPWSREAFDLMDWRPPDREANGKKMADVEEKQ